MYFPAHCTLAHWIWCAREAKSWIWRVCCSIHVYVYIHKCLDTYTYPTPTQTHTPDEVHTEAMSFIWRVCCSMYKCTDTYKSVNIHMYIHISPPRRKHAHLSPVRGSAGAEGCVRSTYICRERERERERERARERSHPTTPTH